MLERFFYEFVNLLNMLEKLVGLDASLLHKYAMYQFLLRLNFLIQQTKLYDHFLQNKSISSKVFSIADENTKNTNDENALINFSDLFTKKKNYLDLVLTTMKIPERLSLRTTLKVA